MCLCRLLVWSPLPSSSSVEAAASGPEAMFPSASASSATSARAVAIIVGRPASFSVGYGGRAACPSLSILSWAVAAGVCFLRLSRWFSWEDCSCAVHLLSQPGRHALVGGLSGVDGVHSPGLCGRSGGTVQSYISTPGVQACVEKKSNISLKLNILHYCECKKLFLGHHFLIHC